MQSTDIKYWERQPHETDKAWLAFQTFLNMPVIDPENPQNERSLVNLTHKLNYAPRGDGRPANIVEQWSAKYKWRDRIRAYDNFMNSITMTVQETGLIQFQQDVIERRTTQIAVMNNILDKTLSEQIKLIDDGVVTSGLELGRIASAMKIIDDLSRRIAHMPTSYIADEADEAEPEQKIYVIGG